MIFKDGVYVRNASPELLLGLSALEECYRQVRPESPMVVTSISEAQHAAEYSCHYSGNAADTRTRDLAQSMCRRILDLWEDYGPMDFKLLLRSNHFHLQYKPRGKMP